MRGFLSKAADRISGVVPMAGAGAVPLVRNIASKAKQKAGGILGGRRRPVIDEEEARRAPNPLDARPTAVTQQAPVQQQGGIFGGIGNWMQSNPEFATGLITSGIGALSGMQPLDYLGLGGRAYSGREAETRRRYEFERQMEAASTPQQININPLDQIQQELQMQGIKDPAEAYNYMRLRSQGKTPEVYKGGFLWKTGKVREAPTGAR